nr:hypothetical protein [Candidatus Sigynarchaeota archaeon]
MATTNKPSNILDLSADKAPARSESISPTEEKLLVVLKEGPLTRDQLVAKLAIPRTTIFDSLKKLIARNEAKKYPLFAAVRSKGRPQVLFSLLDDKKEV